MRINFVSEITGDELTSLIAPPKLFANVIFCEKLQPVIKGELLSINIAPPPFDWVFWLPVKFESTIEPTELVHRIAPASSPEVLEEKLHACKLTFESSKYAAPPFPVESL